MSSKALILLSLLALGEAGVVNLGFCPQATAINNFDIVKFSGLWWEYSSLFRLFQIGAGCKQEVWSSSGSTTTGTTATTSRTRTSIEVSILMETLTTTGSTKTVSTTSRTGSTTTGSTKTVSTTTVTGSTTTGSSTTTSKPSPSGPYTVVFSEVNTWLNQAATVTKYAVYANPANTTSGDLYISTTNSAGSVVQVPNYSIVATDFTNYAVVYNCKPSGLFCKDETMMVLTRAKTPDKTLLDTLYRRLARLRLPAASLKATNQANCILPTG